MSAPASVSHYYAVDFFRMFLAMLQADISAVSADIANCAASYRQMQEWLVSAKAPGAGGRGETNSSIAALFAVAAQKFSDVAAAASQQVCIPPAISIIETVDVCGRGKTASPLVGASGARVASAMLQPVG